MLTTQMFLSKDAEVRYTPAGQMALNLNLGYEYGKPGPDKKKPVQWINGTMWGDRGEKMAQYLTKGTRVLVTMKDVHVREYESRGQTRSSLDGEVINIEFIRGGAKPEGQSNSNYSDRGQARQSAPAQTEIDPPF